VEYGPFPTGRAQLERRVVHRAWADPDYRAWLLADPRAALEKELGFPLPEGFELTVVEERPDHLCLVLPVDMSAFDAEAVWTMTGVQPTTPVARDGDDVRRAAPPPAAPA
jgi:hypothetical protein